MKLSVCVWVIGYMFEVARACLDIPEYYGGLDSSLVIGASTLASPASSCHCCGLCHQDTACRSFSFRPDTGECTLYSRVGGYGEFQRQPAGSQVTQFFFMPSSSGSDEFCRSDSDCVTPGDACRGRICTSEPTVTCRRAWQRNGALPDHRYWGYLDGQEHRLYCRMQGQYSGATLLLASHNVPTDGVAWSADNVLYKLHPRDGYPSEAIDYSILRYADLIRDSMSGSTYEVFMIAHEYQGEPTVVQKLTASRSLTLIGTELVPLSGGQFQVNPTLAYDSGWLAFPYLVNDPARSELYTTINSRTSYLTWRSVVTTGGDLLWPLNRPRSTVVLYIRE